MTLEEYFSTGPPHERAVCEAILAHVRSLGPVHVEPVAVGILVKRSRTFLELRPMQRWEAVCFTLPHPARHPLVTRKVVTYHGRSYHVANVRSPDDIDGRLLDLLSEAYADG